MSINNNTPFGDALDELYESFDKSIKSLGNTYRTWLRKREEYKDFLGYVPKRLMEIPMSYMHQGTFGNRNLYIIMRYSVDAISKMQEIMAEAGWSTNSEITADPTVWLYYSHPAVASPFGITIQVQTAEELSLGENVCVVVPIEWEQQLVPTAYERIYPENHLELFRDGVYIGDDLFPALPKDQDGLKVT